jgi:tetratricopeptide (TPR) repeat protein
MRNSVPFLLLAPFICCLLFAQVKGGGPTAGTPPSIGGNSTSPSPSIPNGSTTTPGNIPTVTRPLYVSGRVMLDDGSVPAQGVTIIRVCNSVTREMGYADSKGNFSFDLNRADVAFQDARTPGRISTNGDPASTGASLDGPFSDLPGNGGLSRTGSDRSALLGCELRAQLSGYRSSAVQLGQRDSLDNPDVGVIFLHRMGPDEGSTISMTSLKAPKDAKKAFEKGLTALKKKKTEDAEKNFQKAVTVYPEYAEAWFQLGALQMDAKDNDAARKSFGQAIAADPRLVTPYVNLAILDAQEGKWKESAESTAKAIRLDPVDFPVAFYFDALDNYNLQNFEQAEKSARQLERLDPQHHFPIANRILAPVLAERKDYPGAAEQMREYLKVAGTAQDADKVRGQLQQLEKLISEQTPAKAR